MKMILTFILIYALIVSQAFAIPFIDRHESYKYGNGTTSTKSFEYDFGLGVLNPKMQVDNAQGFVFDKALSSQGLTSPSLSVTGTGTTTFSGKGLFLDDLTGKNLKASGNALTIGDGASTNKSITFDKGAGASNPFMKWDETQAALVYSNDGTLIKKIGSGSGGGDGGGVNFLKNGGFEDLKANWTESGGTFTAEAFATGIESDLKFGQWVATSASQTLCSDLVATPSFANAGGMFDLAYTASGSQFLVYVKDGSGNKLTTDQSLLDQTAWTKLSPIPFSFNTSQRLCFESKGAATLKLNNVYMGTNKNVTSISQSNRVYKGYWPQMSGCSVYHDSATMGSFTTMSACPAITTEISDGVSADNTDYNTITKFTIGNLKAGKYVVRWHFNYYNSSANYNYFAITDGTSTGQESGSNYVSDASFRYGEIESTFLYSTQQSSKTFELLGKDTASPLLYLYLDISPAYVTVDYYPNSSEQVQTPEASQWFIDANIGGANIDYGTPAVSSYTELTNSGLDLVLNQGSAPSQIACTNGTDSTGLTCSVNESLGITFTNPYSGYFEACFDLSLYSTDGAITNQLIETTPMSTSIVQEGKTKVSNGIINLNTVRGLFSNRLCGTFYFSDIKRRTIRLMFEKDVTVIQQIIADRASALGQRDIHITVRPLLQNSLRAILTGDQVTAPGSNKPKIVSGFAGVRNSGVCSSGTCSLTQVGNSVASVVFSTTGEYLINFVSGTWTSSDSYTCTFTPDEVASGTYSGAWANWPLGVHSATQTSVRWSVPNNVSVNTSFSFICSGY